MTALAMVLTEHYVTAIDCDHDAKTDTVRCSCSVWTGTPQPSVGAAVRQWADHVLAMWPNMGMARALHDWRKTQSLAGCGWRFASVVDDEPLCPCPADAAAILALLGEGDPFASEVDYGPWRNDPSDAGREVRRRRRAQAVNDEVVERLDRPGNRANLDAPTPKPLGDDE